MLTPDNHRLFSLDMTNTYLDHGGFGATPESVLLAAAQWRDRIEKNPRQFLHVDYPDLWKEAATGVARRFAAKEGDVALVENTTDGINAILRSQSFQKDDEILILSVAYGAIAMAAKQIARQSGARVVEVPIKYPSPDPQQCIEAVKAALTPHTKLAIFDHIASGTGLLLPVKEMIRACHEQKVVVIVDGAHAPGQVALDIPALDADWYVGNLHKWYFVPRGCGFIWARDDRQAGLLPAVLSWEIDKPFPISFSWTGTRDASSWLSIPAAFQFMDRFGEEHVRQHNHKLVVRAMRLLSDAWGGNMDTTDCMIGSMGIVPLPQDIPFSTTDESRQELLKKLTEVHHVTCPCIMNNGRLYARISAQIYNKIEDYEVLARAVNSLRTKHSIS